MPTETKPTEPIIETKSETKPEAAPSAAPIPTISPEEYQALQQRLQETEQYAATYAQLYQQAIAQGQSPQQAKETATQQTTQQATDDSFLTRTTAKPLVQEAMVEVLGQLQQQQAQQQYIQNFETEGEKYVKENYQVHDDKPEVWLHIKELAKAYKANGLPDKAAYDRAVLGYAQRKSFGASAPQNTMKGVPEVSTQFTAPVNDASAIALQEQEVAKLKDLALTSGKHQHEIDYYKAIDKLHAMRNQAR